MRVRTEEYKKRARENARAMRARNPELHRERVRRSRKKALDSDPDFHHKKDLVRFYGVTHAWYQETLERQGFSCGICKKPAEKNDCRFGKPMRLAVDHCHATGEIRGLLCNSCNRGIGLLDHDRKTLLAAIAYLSGGLT